MSERRTISLEILVRLCEQAITEEIWFDDNECTRKLMTAFSEFAHRSGYRVEQEFHTIDMVWWSDGRMIVAIESENDPRTGPIENEWKKLIYIDADNKLLVSYCSDANLREAWLKRAEQIIAGNPRSKDSAYYLILGDRAFYGFRGYEFDSSGRTIKRVRAQERQ